MKNTEQEFWVLDELITMPNRALAQRAYCLLWDGHGVVDQGFMDRMVEIIVDSTCISWRADLAALVDLEMEARGLHGVVPASRVASATHGL